MSKKGKGKKNFLLDLEVCCCYCGDATLCKSMGLVGAFVKPKK
jgi:hypothetical protein